MFLLLLLQVQFKVIGKLPFSFHLFASHFLKTAQQLMARSGVQMIFDGPRISSKIHSHHSRRFLFFFLNKNYGYDKNRYKLTLCSQFCLVSFLREKKQHVSKGFHGFDPRRLVCVATGNAGISLFLSLRV